MSDAFEIISTVRCFNGNLYRFSHYSSTTNTKMTCAVYLPDITPLSEYATGSAKFPFLMYLSGLTCNDENVCQKSGVFYHLSKHKLAFVAPDTSPRDTNIDGDHDSYDFGIGAGFYLDATVGPYSKYFNMYSYITVELPMILAKYFPMLNHDKVGLFGHSMGGHGALTIGLKNPDKFKSVSAFSPICRPTQCPWGVKAFTGYLGGSNEQDIPESWKRYDASLLVASQEKTYFDDILIDVGLNDNFLKNGQLQCKEFESVCQNSNQNVTVRYQDGFDHSYYFISTFMEDHVAYHAKYLQ